MPTRYRLLLAAAGLGLVAVTWWMLSSGASGTAVATDLGFPLAVLSLLAAIFGVPGKEASDDAELAAAARGLARDVGGREGTQQQRLLADTGKPQPSDVGFVQPKLVSWRTDGGARIGSLKNIQTFYTKLSLGRLVILGEAGAGKTVLANQLLLDLVTPQLSQKSPREPTLTVPVRLSLPSFDPSDDAHDNQPAILSARLDAWIISHLTDVYGLTPRTADALLQNGRILPILDGLDEMDPATANPARASAVIRALNHPVGGAPRPVVITCRADRYQQLASTDAGPGQQPVLQDATVVHIQPITPARVCAYLTRRFPHPASPKVIQPRWQPVLDHITDHPKSSLANALASPLRLYLAITAYYSPATDPSELTNLPNSKTIDHHLLNELIPATIDQHPKPDGTTYNPGDVTRWLTTLANHLRACQTREGGSGSDIKLQELWTAAGNREPRYVAATLLALLTALLLALAGWYLLDVGSLGEPVPVIGVGIVIVGFVFAWAMRERVALYRLDLSRLRTTTGRRQLAIWLAAGLAVGLAVGLCLGVVARAIGYTGEFTTWPAAGVALGLTIGLMAGLRHQPSAISHPRQVVRQGMTHDLTILLGAGLAGGLTVGLTVGLTGWLTGWLTAEHLNGVAQAAQHRMQVNSQVFQQFDQAIDLPREFAVGLTAGLTGGLALGLAVGAAANAGSPWLRYLVATHILARRCELPQRPAPFLDWAYDAGLLRLAGISPQFRHRELQEHLTSQPKPNLQGSDEARQRARRPIP